MCTKWLPSFPSKWHLHLNFDELLNLRLSISVLSVHIKSLIFPHLRTPAIPTLKPHSTTLNVLISLSPWLNIHIISRARLHLLWRPLCIIHEQGTRGVVWISKVCRWELEADKMVTLNMYIQCRIYVIHLHPRALAVVSHNWWLFLFNCSLRVWVSVKFTVGRVQQCSLKLIFALADWCKYSHTRWYSGCCEISGTSSDVLLWIRLCTYKIHQGTSQGEKMRVLFSI